MKRIPKLLPYVLQPTEEQRLSPCSLEQSDNHDHHGLTSFLLVLRVGDPGMSGRQKGQLRVSWLILTDNLLFPQPPDFDFGAVETTQPTFPSSQHAWTPKGTTERRTRSLHTEDCRLVLQGAKQLCLCSTVTGHGEGKVLPRPQLPKPFNCKLLQCFGMWSPLTRFKDCHRGGWWHSYKHV